MLHGKSLFLNLQTPVKRVPLLIIFCVMKRCTKIWFLAYKKICPNFFLKVLKTPPKIIALLQINIILIDLSQLLMALFLAVQKLLVGEKKTKKAYTCHLLF